MKNFVSIIIPCKEIDSYTKKCIIHCLKQEYKKFEIIILPDIFPNKKEGIKNKKIKIIPTGNVIPAIKRNIGKKYANGNFLAFIDSDAYPDRKWLKNAIEYFKKDTEQKIAIIGGPNLTPEDASENEKISGYILQNFLASGKASIRYKKAKKQFVKELPSCNFIVRKEYVIDFPKGLLTAEDTKFCYSVLEKGKKILYVPEVIVYHHRREFLAKHAKQIWIYGRDVAFLIKKEKSKEIRKSIPYFSLLSILSIYLTLGIVSNFLFSGSSGFFNFTLFLYLIIILLSSIKINLITTVKIFIGIITTHFAYGYGFLYGLFTKQK